MQRGSINMNVDMKEPVTISMMSALETMIDKQHEIALDELMFFCFSYLLLGTTQSMMMFMSFQIMSLEENSANKANMCIQSLYGQRSIDQYNDQCKECTKSNDMISSNDHKYYNSLVPFKGD